MIDQPRLLYLITEDWYFWSHRVDLARETAHSGFDICIATRVTDHGERITHEGFRLCPITLSRRSKNPLVELRAVWDLIRLYRKERPLIVHHVALKPILYGSFAAWWSRIPVVVNAFAGLGYAFTARERQHGILHWFLRMALKLLLKLSNSVVVFQNDDDRELFLNAHMVTKPQTRVIAGSGIDTDIFSVRPLPVGEPIVMLASRMLWDKGVGDFIEAIRHLRKSGVSARFVLAGRCDEDNPAAIPRQQILQWVDEKLVEYWGHRDDMRATLAEASIVVLPSYREGLPKILLEASACGRPLIATDVPGCRDVVKNGINGLLVPPGDPAALAGAIRVLLNDPKMRATMGTVARETVVQQFSIQRITSQTISLYRELLGRPTAGVSGSS